MNFKLLIIFIVGIGALSYGFLGNDILLDIQELDVIIMPPEDGSLSDATQFSTVECLCDNDSDGDFETCNTTPGDPNSLGPNGNMLCT